MQLSPKLQSATTICGLTSLMQEAYRRHVRKLGEHVSAHPCALIPASRAVARARFMAVTQDDQIQPVIKLPGGTTATNFVEVATM